MLPYVVQVHRERLHKLRDLLLQVPNIKTLATTNAYEVFRMQYIGELLIGYTSGKIVVNGPLRKDLLTKLTGSPESARYDLATASKRRPKGKFLTAYIDGLCEPKNPDGIASYGLVIYSNNKKIYEERKVVGKGKGISNNVAEYSALVALLQYLLDNNIEGKVHVRSDSQLVIYQMKGEWDVKDGLYVDKWYEARKLMKDLKNELRFEWIEREENFEADKLSRQAYEEYCKSHGIEVKYHKEEES